MNSVKAKCHIKAISENLELGLIGGVLASGVDSFWVITDILHNGLSAHYIVILVILVMSTVILLMALVRHHKSNVKHELGVMFMFKKSLCRAKNRKARHIKYKGVF